MYRKRIVGRKMVVVAAVFMALVSVTLPAAGAGSGDAFISKYIDAIGGEKAIGKIKNRVVKGTFALPDMGMTATMETYLAPPNSLSIINIDGMGEVVTGVSNGVAWRMHFMEGNAILEGAEKDRALRQGLIEELVEWKKWYETAECVAVEKVGEAEAYKVVMTPKEGEPSTIYFDKESGLIIQRESTQDGMPSTATVTDYRKVDGLLLSHKTVISGMMTFEITYDSIEHNVDLASDRFDLPDEIKALMGEEGSSSKEEDSSAKEE